MIRYIIFFNENVRFIIENAIRPLSTNIKNYVNVFESCLVPKNRK